MVFATLQSDPIAGDLGNGICFQIHEHDMIFVKDLEVFCVDRRSFCSIWMVNVGQYISRVWIIHYLENFGFDEVGCRIICRF